MLWWHTDPTLGYTPGSFFSPSSFWFSLSVSFVLSGAMPVFLNLSSVPQPFQSRPVSSYSFIFTSLKVMRYHLVSLVEDRYSQQQQAAGWAHGPLPPAPFLWAYREDYGRAGGEATHTGARSTPQETVPRSSTHTGKAAAVAPSLPPSTTLFTRATAASGSSPCLCLDLVFGTLQAPSLRLVLGTLPHTSQECCCRTGIHAAGVLCNTPYTHPVTHVYVIGMWCSDPPSCASALSWGCWKKKNHTALRKLLCPLFLFQAPRLDSAICLFSEASALPPCCLLLKQQDHLVRVDILADNLKLCWDCSFPLSCDDKVHNTSCQREVNACDGVAGAVDVSNLWPRPPRDSLNGPECGALMRF